MPGVVLKALRSDDDNVGQFFIKWIRGWFYMKHVQDSNGYKTIVFRYLFCQGLRPLFISYQAANRKEKSTCIDSGK